MAKKKNRVRIIEGDERVCPVCHTGPIYYVREGVSYCAAEDPHPGGVMIYDDHFVRLDRHLHDTQLTPI